MRLPLLTVPDHFAAEVAATGASFCEERMASLRYASSSEPSRCPAIVLQLASAAASKELASRLKSTPMSCAPTLLA